MPLNASAGRMNSNTWLAAGSNPRNHPEKAEDTPPLLPGQKPSLAVK